MTGHALGTLALLVGFGALSAGLVVAFGVVGVFVASVLWLILAGALVDVEALRR